MSPEEELQDAAANLLTAYRERFTGGGPSCLFGPIDPEVIALENAYRRCVNGK